ncbi:gephyrin-like molybdotransferase Glp [Paenibacillus sp.]|uniref:molybdopterin molybdotransferase MoeA n=1 Tax=Paenibacillus sp. TaxID=58172 RepID=UPI002D325F0B|nr:gephyrin-like molybdotransferase Glp [Paenibacillus sp.]HZG88224.1 gephyrin-like molybdotransferase Glp [Paenibacillus sp.]
MRSADKFDRSAVSVSEALRRVLEAVSPVGAERAALDACYGRRAAEDVVAREPVPHFRRSGMDGYAVRAADTAGASPAAPATLRVVGELACGEVAKFAVPPGGAARIMTGAMMPDGADAVVMLEMTEIVPAAEGGEAIRVRRAAAAGMNVSEVGSDVPEGTVIVRRGERLGGAEAALLAATGAADVAVFRKPRIAIVPTGSELLPIASPAELGKIRNSNAYMLAALTASAGGAPVPFAPVPDSAEALAEAIGEAAEACDLVLTTGGVSVGDYDIMADYLRAPEQRMLFNKVMMRPGSVTSAAVRGGKLILGLSGNPGACAAGFELLARPAIKALQGCANPEPILFEAELAEPFPKTNAYPRYVRGTYWSEGGRLKAAAEAGDKSARMLPGLGAACYVVIPPGGRGWEAGDPVAVLPLEP